MRAPIIALTALGAAVSIPAAAQTHAGHGATQTRPPAETPDRAVSPLKGHASHEASDPSPGDDPHAGHADHREVATPADPHADHRAQAADPHAGHGIAQEDHSAHGGQPADGSDPHAGGTALPAGNAPPPPVPADWYADRSFDPAEMAQVRAAQRRAHGGGTYSQVIVDIAEYRAIGEGGGYAWKAEAWYGGDINRLVLKTEGAGRFRGDLDHAEVEALYSRAIDPYWNLQAGLRYDFEPSRAYAAVGVEGLAPYWFELEGAVFLSDRGDVFARASGYHDVRLTQRLILQPRAEINLSAQGVPRDRIGAGLSSVELGVRLRYEFAREFAPYVGVHWERSFGDTADFARADGRDVSNASFVAGVRLWF